MAAVVRALGRASRAPAGRAALRRRAPRCASTDTAAPAAEAPPAAPAPHEGLDIRVGRVLKAYEHPEAEKLFVEEVDVGEEEPRTICSGLKGYVPLDSLEGSLVVVLANLKARNMVGVKSHGMLLAASDEAHENVELIVPPEGAEVGERVVFAEDFGTPQGDPLAENRLQKKKVWEAVAPDLVTTADKVVSIKGLPMMTSAGPVTTPTLANATVG